MRACARRWVRRTGRKVAIVVKGTGKHTLGLLDFAVEHCRYAPETFDHVWLVFDKDDFPATKVGEIFDVIGPYLDCCVSTGKR